MVFRRVLFPQQTSRAGRWSRLCPSRKLRGFTLIELMVVVVIVGILAVIAVPSVTDRLRERRSQEAAERIALLYRTARMRAMGRGGAVFVRFTSGGFFMFEAVAPMQGDPSCVLPFTGCANPPQTTEVTRLDLPNRSEYSGIAVAEGASRTELEVCYSPLGRAFVRGAPADPLAPLASVLTFDVNRGSGAGLTRRVTVLPNGIARVAARPLP